MQNMRKISCTESDVAVHTAICLHSVLMPKDQALLLGLCSGSRRLLTAML